MATPTRREQHGPLDIFELLETPWTVLRPVAGHPIRIEDYVRDGSYVVRAELPGIDPEKDLEVTVSGGILTIKADRKEPVHPRHRSEFRYGTFARSVTLPASAQRDHVEAVYGHGILEVTIALADGRGEHAGRKIPVRVNRHVQPT
jgi:HSP20 family protein